MQLQGNAGAVIFKRGMDRECGRRATRNVISETVATVNAGLGRFNHLHKAADSTNTGTCGVGLRMATGAPANST